MTQTKQANTTKTSPGREFLALAQGYVNPNKKTYFTAMTEAAVVAYNQETDQEIRNQVFNLYLKRPLDKLVENIIHRFKFYYFDIPHDAVKHETVAFIVERIDKFDHTKGFKAYSYFSIVAKHYLIANNNANYDMMKRKCDVSVVDDELNAVNEYYNKEGQEEVKAFFDMFVKYVDKNLLVIFPKVRDQRVADAILELFKNRQNIFSYNKKALYILIRERSGVQTQYITRIINMIRSLYYRLYEEYQQTGRIDYTYTK
jgi:hypothetical protein